MPDSKRQSGKPDRRLVETRLYTGESDSEIQILETSLGEVAVASVADETKPRENEDAAAVIPVGDDGLLLVVADGVGGAMAARRASNTTVETLSDMITGADPDPQHLRTYILDGIEAANQTLLGLGTGAATTLAAAEIADHSVRTYHVGDSSIWLCGQRGAIKMQTTPHSPVGMALEAGFLDEDEALNHEELHLISNAVGSYDMRIEISSGLRMSQRDTLLLASDGLFDNVLQDEIIEIIRKGPLETAIHSLTELSLERMRGKDADKPSKPDDYSVILFRPRAVG